MKHNKWTCLESKVTLQFMGKIKQKKRKEPSKNPRVLPPPKNKLQQLLLLVSSCDSRLPLFSLLLTNKDQTKTPQPSSLPPLSRFLFPMLRLLPTSKRKPYLSYAFSQLSLLKLSFLFPLNKMAQNSHLLYLFSLMPDPSPSCSGWHFFYPPPLRDFRNYYQETSAWTVASGCVAGGSRHRGCWRLVGSKGPAVSHRELSHDRLEGASPDLSGCSGRSAAGKLGC